MSVPRVYRIGQIVPSSNITMEAEVPAMLMRAQVPAGAGFSFHSSRAPMQTVAAAELTAMNAHMTRCALELVDARMDVIASACLVAIMCQGPEFHRETERSLGASCRAAAPQTAIVTSAGALIAALQAIGARRIAMITTYMRSLTTLMIAYIESEGIEVVDALSLEIPDNCAVATHDPMALGEAVKRLDTTTADAIVLSACVQLPSLPALASVQRHFEVAVLSAAAATVFGILRALSLPTHVPAAGDLLSGRFA